MRIGVALGTGGSGALGDTTAPTLSSPTDTNSGSTGYSGSVSTNEGNGTLYWVVSTSSTAPTAVQVEAGQMHTGSSAAASGNQAVSATGVQNVSGSGLTSSTAYTIHFMHKDAAGNRSSVVSGDGLTTAAIVPTLSSPTDTNAGAFVYSGGVTTDNATGTLYWVVTTSSTAPTKAQVKSGLDNAGAAAAATGSQAISSSGAKTISGAGLAASTSYTIHFMHEDGSGNQSNVVSGDGLTTAAATVQVFTTSGSFQAPAGIPFWKVEGIGAGAQGWARGATTGAAGGAGGGAYARLNAYPVTPGNTYSFTIGAGGSGTATNFNSGALIAAVGSNASSATGRSGGSAANSTGDVKFDGGAGGTSTGSSGGGGGGAAGPGGAGKDGGATSNNGAAGGGGCNGGSSTAAPTAASSTTGGNGGTGPTGTAGGTGSTGAGGAGSNGSGGAGGGTTTRDGGNGSQYIVWTRTSDSATFGPGSGSGGASTGASGTSGSGVGYGGGTGGGRTTGTPGGGLLVISY